MEDCGTHPSSWEKERSDLHADCRVFRILRERWQDLGKRASSDFFVMEVADWALAIALTDDNRCVLVRQWRFGSQDFTWELPAGVVDPGETPLEAGMRELYEESGYKGGSARIIGTVYPNPAIQRNRCHFVLIEGAWKAGAGNPGPHEAFEVEALPLATVVEWARSGTISHAIVHAALFQLQAHIQM
jgi:8-oxo-dGTP pyrophosphatase MutT (NUDIX family)